MAKAQRWLPLFQDYLRDFRVRSKNEYDPEGNGVQLRMYSSQRMLLEQICDGLEHDVHIFYILKSRQLGATTITHAILLFWLALHPGTKGCLVADTPENLAAFREDITFYVKSLSRLMGRDFSLDPRAGGKSNRGMFLFSNGSQLDLLVAGKHKTAWGESRGYVVGHLTEVGNYGKPEGLASFNETLSESNPNRLYIYESRAYGPNHWQDYWEEGQRDPHTIRCIFVGWWSLDAHVIKRRDPRFAIYGSQDPMPRERELMDEVHRRFGHRISIEQLAWYRWRSSQKTTSAADIDQNQPWTPEMAFVETGTSFFQVRDLAERRKLLTDTPPAPVSDGGYSYQPWSFSFGAEWFHSKTVLLPPDIDRNSVLLRVWEEPDQNGEYVIGVDPAYGRSDEADRHAIEVCRCFSNKLVQVAEYADNRTDTRTCAWVLAMLAGLYSNCMINVDMQGGPGEVVVGELNNLRERLRTESAYEEVQKRGLEDFMAAFRWYMFRRVDSVGAGFLWHTKTNYSIKNRMMNKLRDNHATNLLEIRSVPLIDEMMGVRYRGGDIAPSATGRHKDDRVFAMALANMTWEEHVRTRMIFANQTWELANAQDSGEVTPASAMMQRRLHQLFLRADELAFAEPPHTFLDDRGLR